MKIDLCFAHLRLFANAYLPQKVKSYDLKALNIVIIVQVSSDAIGTTMMTIAKLLVPKK